MHSERLSDVATSCGWLLVAWACGVGGECSAAGRDVFDLNLGWRYHAGDVADASRVGFNDSEWETVALPHTYRLTSLNLDDSTDDASQPTFHRDVSWYRRTLQPLQVAGKRVFLEFEGAHQVTEVWVNGERAGVHSVGAYTPFHFDVTDLVRGDGSDLVAVRLDNRPNEDVPPDGHRRDYVLFGGLYRDVRLVVTDSLHVTFPWEAREAGVRITTPSVSPRGATVTCETAITNAGKERRRGRVVTLIADGDREVVERLESPFELPAGATQTVVQTGGVHERVRLWSCEDPDLYRVHTLIEDDHGVVDHVVNPLGLRWFDLLPGIGFRLNGQPTELIGTNRHQQYPYLGDAVPNNLHRGDAIRFKRAGFNMVRLAHYPHDDAFLDACDELGLLVCEEPPTWIEFGPPEWWDRLEQAQRRMIRNHRNHPCVLGWGGGVNHRGSVRRLHYAAKEEDPTRITMSNGTLWTGPRNAGATDLYSAMDYRGATVPSGGLLFGMEHSGSIDAAVHQELVARYRSDPDRIGLTLWSAHDGFSFMKRGEQRPNLSRWKASVWDPFRLAKPAYHWYRSELRGEPIVWIPDDRAQQPGSVLVFSNCEEVALETGSGVVQQRRPDPEGELGHLRAPPFVFQVDAQGGPLTATGFKDGVAVAIHEVFPPGVPSHLEVAFDTDGFDGLADGSSVLLAYARVCDEQGTTVTDAAMPVTFSVEGPATIVGDERIGANPVVWERGIAPVLVRVGETEGEITLRANALSVRGGSASLSLHANASERAPMELPFERRRHRVDLGGATQHVQEGWTAWSADGGPTSISLADRVDPPATLSVRGGSEPAWTTNWGVPGERSFLIEDGFESKAAIELSIRDLPDGRYTLRSWHHRVAPTRNEAPPLDVFVSDADRDGEPVIKGYQPTYGREIVVAEDGGGSRGDGGADTGADRPVELTFRAVTPEAVLVRFTAQGGGDLTLNGLELVGEAAVYRPGRGRQGAGATGAER